MKIKLDSLTTLCRRNNFLDYFYHDPVSLPRGFYSGDKCVYVVLDPQYQINNSLWLWNYPYAIKYIGMGNYTFSAKRPFSHKNDLFNDNLIINPNRYLLTFPSTALNTKSAFDLESILIDEALHLGYVLSPYKLRHTETVWYQLWNKSKGHKRK